MAPGQRRSALELKKGMGCKAPRGNGAVSADVSGSSAESRSLGKPEKAEPGTFEAQVRRPTRIPKTQGFSACI